LGIFGLFRGFGTPEGVRTSRRAGFYINPSRRGTRKPPVGGWQSQRRPGAGEGPHRGEGSPLSKGAGKVPGDLDR